MSTEFIICAAIKVNGKIFYGHRHDNCLNAMNSELSWTLTRKEITALDKIQGFVTSTGRFVGRTEAAKLWIAAGGVLENPPLLYSEDIY